ncbi:MAG TPA: hypothetical protein VEK80_13860 [Kribbellaceae bacterium]|nr:hypothetical protein [Kribbellaceae bacterium]
MTPDAFDPTRPLAFGYLRAHILMTENELADAKADLADFAAREGFCLAAVFVERIDRAPAAFTALVAEVKCSEAQAVIVPGLHHLAPARRRAGGAGPPGALHRSPRAGRAAFP